MQVSAHKGLAAYALGASVVQSGASTRRFWAVIGLFSAATPLGIALGFAFSEVSSGAGGAAMSALAAGTFLYVALAEVIPRELSVPNDDLRSYKLLALVTGFALMSLLAIWA